MLDRKQKWRALAASDVFALPSYQENFGISVVEALAAGIPVLISNRVNIYREIQSAKAGFVAEASLAGAEQLLLDWRELTRQIEKVCQTQQKTCFAKL